MFKKSQAVPPVTPPAGQPVTPPATPPRKSIIPGQPATNPSSTGTPPPTDDASILKQLAPDLWENLQKLINKSKLAESNYETYDKMLTSQMNASLSSSMKMPASVDFCSVMSISDDAVVDAQEIETTYNSWKTAADAYIATTKEIIQAYDALGSKIPSLLVQYPQYQNSTTVSNIELSRTEFVNKYNTLNSAIVISERRNAKFFAMLPLQQEFFTLMATLCPIQQDKEATKSTLGFAFNEQYQALMHGFDQAIQLATALARIVLNSWQGSGSQSARINSLKYLAIASGFKKEKQELINESSKRYRVT